MLEGVRLSSGVELAAAGLRGHGRANIRAIHLGPLRLAGEFIAPVSIAPDAVRLAPLTGSLARGRLDGELVAAIGGPFQYQIRLRAQGADAAELLRWAGAEEVVGGVVQADIALAGSGGLSGLAGTGRVEVVNGRWQGLRVLERLSALLDLPELRDRSFSEGHLEFTIRDSVLDASVIRWSGADIWLSGSGRVSLADNSCHRVFRLVLSEELLAKVGEEKRSRFAREPDGRRAIGFRFGGPCDQPRIELEPRRAEEAVEEPGGLHLH